MADGLQPTFDINGNNGNNGGWGNWGGALIGGAIGGAFGSGWNRNGNNNGNCGCGCGGNQMLMDALSGLRTDVGSISRDQLLQSANNLAQQCTGFGTVNASVERVGAAAALAAARQEAATLTVGYQGQLQAKDNTFAIVSSQKDCCCQTQRLIEAEGCATRQAIHSEGEATRAMLTQNEIQALRDRLATAEGQLASSNAREFATALSNQAQANIIAAVRAIVPTTATPATTTPAA